MARLPRYQRLGVRTRQPQGVELAGYREQARSAQAMSSAVEQMSGFLYKQAQVEAQERGLERVRSEGAQPLLEAMQEQGGPRGLEERTAYEAANRIAVAEIASEAELEITKILDNGQANKQSFSAIQARLKDVSDGFPAALSNIDPVSAGLLRARLQESTGKAELRYSKWWTGEITKRAKEKQNMVAANEAEFILGNAAVPGYERSAIDDDVAKGSQTLLDLGVEPNKVEEWAKGITQEAYKQNFLFDFYQRPINEQGELMESILTGDQEIEGMTYEDGIRFVNGLLRPEYNRNLAAVKSQSDFVVNKTGDLEDLLESGGQITEDQLNQIRSMAVDVEQFDGGKGLAAINELTDASDMFAQLRGATLSQAEAMVLELQDGADGTLDTALEVKRYEQASKFLNNMRTQIKQDPMGYAERVGLIERQQIISLDENGRPQVDETALAQRAMQAQTVAGYYGLPSPKMLFGNEAREIGVILDASEGQAKLDILGALATFGEASGEVLTDLADYNPSMALVGGLVNSGSEEAARLAIAGMDRLKAGEKPIGFSRQYVDPVFRDFMQRAVTTPKHSQAIKNVAEAIYLDLSYTRGITGDVMDESLYKEALQLASGYRVVNGQEYGGIQEIRGVPTFIPPYMTNNDMSFIMEQFTAEGVERATGQKIDRFLAQSIQRNDSYKIRNIGGNKYVIEYGKNGDVTVADENEEPIIFSIDTLKDAMILAPTPQATMEAPEITPPPQAMQADIPDLPGATITPDVADRPEYPEARMVSKAQKGKLDKMIKDAGVSADEFEDRVQPLMSTARDNISNDRYLDYVQSVLTGYNKPFSEWEKENP